MLGEAEAWVNDLKCELETLQRERDVFCAANEDTMHEFLYNKRVREYDERIEKLEDELRAAVQEYDEILDAEVEYELRHESPLPDPFEEEFKELASMDDVSFFEKP